VLHVHTIIFIVNLLDKARVVLPLFALLSAALQHLSCSDMDRGIRTEA
jgi:hypothetical protein